MREPNRRDQAADETRRKILTAAADCIVRDGLANVRMAAIAKAAGVSAGLAHYHFSTKEQLLVAVLSHSSALSRELTERAADGASRHPADRLALLLDRCLPSDPQLTRDWWLWQELDLICLRQPDLAGVGAEVYEDLYESIEAVLSDGADEGVFALDRDELRPVAECAVALCDGLGERVLSPDDLSLADARARVALAAGKLVGHAGPLPLPDQPVEAAVKATVKATR